MAMKGATLDLRDAGTRDNDEPRTGGAASVMQRGAVSRELRGGGAIADRHPRFGLRSCGKSCLYWNAEAISYSSPMFRKNQR
jgi:hypothetical protein